MENNCKIQSYKNKLETRRKKISETAATGVHQWGKDLHFLIFLKFAFVVLFRKL